MPGPSVFPSGEPGLLGAFWGSQEGCQGPFRPSGRNRGQGLVPLRWGCALPSPNAPGKAPNHIHNHPEDALFILEFLYALHMSKKCNPRSLCRGLDPTRPAGDGLPGSPDVQTVTPTS